MLTPIFTPQNKLLEGGVKHLAVYTVTVVRYRHGFFYDVPGVQQRGAQDYLWSHS